MPTKYSLGVGTDKKVGATASGLLNRINNFEFLFLMVSWDSMLEKSIVCNRFFKPKIVTYIYTDESNGTAHYLDRRNEIRYYAAISRSFGIVY